MIIHLKYYQKLKHLFESWVEDYSQKLYNRAFYLLNSTSDAEDLVQDVFVIAFEKFAQFQGKSSPLTWLMAILHNKVSDRYRLKYKGETKISLDLFFDENRFWKNPESLLIEWNSFEKSEEEILDEYLEHCLDLLPERWLLIIKLTYLQEKKTSELCQDMGLTKTNFWKILQRSRLQLRECIEKKF